MDSKGDSAGKIQGWVIFAGYVYYTIGNELNWRLTFIFLLPQAAIGGLALDQAIKDKNETLKPLGLTVLTMAVLSIIITAPIGALAIAISGPRFLKSDHIKNELSCSSNDHQDSQEKEEKIVIETETVGEKPCLTEAADVVTHIWHITSQKWNIVNGLFIEQS